MKLFFAFFLVTGLWAAARAQPEKPLSKELKAFVIKGYEVLGAAEGDVNGDGRKDAVLVLKQAGEDSLSYELAETASRPLLLLTRDAGGRLKQAVRNDDLVLCAQCGGVFGDPWEGISISKGQIMINFYGGSNWRWSIQYVFAWQATAKDWLLVQERNISYHTSDPDKAKEEVIPGSEMLQASLGGFGKAFEDCTGKWKVTAAKTFFYNNPVTGSAPRKGYLLKGNVVECSRELKNFVKVYFNNDKNQSTEGYILKKDLVRVVE
jgi:hypothetical protein